MYVCVCKAITEGDIHEAVRNGTHSVKQLTKDLGLGTECGLCVGCANHCLKKALQQTGPINRAVA